MIHISDLDEGLEVFKALGSDVRVQILNLLIKNERMSMNQLASSLNITNGALTSHIKKLEECGLISIGNESASHGNQKICSITQDKILIEFPKISHQTNSFSTYVRVGQYTNHDIRPNCGLATSNSVIGELNDSRFFSHPDRFNADIIWFSEGFVEYDIPNMIPEKTQINQLSISIEISSEATGINSNWPSDINFYINNTYLGMWTSPGDYSDVKGLFTPEWWPQSWNQYGLLKTLTINSAGTFMDAYKLSDITIENLNLDYSTPIRFKLAIENDARNKGGLTLFGKSFGNLGQDIKIDINYESIH